MSDDVKVMLAWNITKENMRKNFKEAFKKYQENPDENQKLYDIVGLKADNDAFAFAAVVLAKGMAQDTVLHTWDWYLENSESFAHFIMFLYSHTRAVSNAPEQSKRG